MNNVVNEIQQKLNYSNCHLDRIEVGDKLYQKVDVQKRL